MKKLVTTVVWFLLVMGCACAPLLAQAEKKPAAKEAAAKPAAKKEAAKKEPSKAAPGEPMDINSASKTELMKLKGIGDAYSDRIIKNRPYSGKDDLVNRKIIPRATYEKIQDQIIARQK